MRSGLADESKPSETDGIRRAGYLFPTRGANCRDPLFQDLPFRAGLSWASWNRERLVYAELPIVGNMVGSLQRGDAHSIFRRDSTVRAGALGPENAASFTCGARSFEAAPLAPWPSFRVWT